MSNEVIQLPELNETLISILGRQCYQCSDIADCMRHAGIKVPFKAEQEQAYALHFLLNEYLGAEDKSAWEGPAHGKLVDMRPATVGRVKAARLAQLEEKATLTRVYITDMVPESGDPIWFAVMALKGSLVDAHYFRVGQDALTAFKRDFSGQREFKDVPRPLGSLTMLEMLEKVAEAEKEQLLRASATTVPGDKVFIPKH